MADFTINTLDDLFAAFDTIRNESYTDEITNINIQKDIDFNDYSKYWYNQSTIFQIDFAKVVPQTININGNGHSIKNIYLVNGRIFYINFYNIATDQFQTLNFYDIDFDFVLNRNPVETVNSLAFSYINPASINGSCSMGSRVFYYNCTFRSKLFLASVSNNYSKSLFEGNSISTIYQQFTNCIFNIELYRSYYNSNYSQSNFIFGFKKADSFVIVNSQFYIKLYLTDNYSGNTNLDYFLAGKKIHNSFFVFDIRANNSDTYFYISDSYTYLSNTYFVIKKTNKTFSKQAKLRLHAAATSSSSTNNFVTIDPSASDEEQVLVENMTSSNIRTIDYQNAKDADYLIDNVGFTIKAND